MAEVVKKKKGKMVNIENWGKRRLAYPIDKLDEAVYVFFHYTGDPDIPQELQRRFRQTETIIRYLTLRKEAQPYARRKTKAAKREKPKKSAERMEEKEDLKEEPEEDFQEILSEKDIPERETSTEEK
jgi:small subunit ribosomal protein S6